MSLLEKLQSKWGGGDVTVATLATVRHSLPACVAKVAGVAVASLRKLPLVIRLARLMRVAPGESGSAAFSRLALGVPGQVPPVPVPLQ